MTDLTSPLLEAPAGLGFNTSGLAGAAYNCRRHKLLSRAHFLYYTNHDTDVDQQTLGEGAIVSTKTMLEARHRTVGGQIVKHKAAGI